MSNRDEENRNKKVSFDEMLKEGQLKHSNDVRKNSMVDKSFMEIENKREKNRWLYMSELDQIFGDRRHGREEFRKIFESRVRSFHFQLSFNTRILIISFFYHPTLHFSINLSSHSITSTF